MALTNSGPEASGSQTLHLKTVLQQIHQEDCPTIPNPEGCKKRASVALIIRIRNTYPHQAVYDRTQCSSTVQPFQECLDNFFSQEWVQEGDAEVLFIKRAARKGDRWTGHIACPGGMREGEDADDRATSSRETREEIGLDLDVEHCLYVGNLPERVVESPRNRKPLMVLCPFVYLMLRNDFPALMLQPSEVHSAHWVPLRGLLAPSLRTFERWDLSKGSVRHQSYMMRMLTQNIAGSMLFGGVRLKPSESLYCSSASGFIPETRRPATWLEAANHAISNAFTGGRAQHVEDDSSLVLWGLTMGIMADFLEMLDGHVISKLWYWPTFSPLDIQAIVWLLTYRFRSQKLRELTTNKPGKPGDVRVSGLDATTFTISVLRRSKGSESGTAGALLLEGYYDRLFKALYVALFARFGFCLAVTTFIVRRYRRRST